MRRAEHRRLLALELHRIDGDDVAGPGQAGALDRSCADPTQTDHRDVVAGLHVRRVDRRSPSGRHPAPDEAGELQRDVVVDLHAAHLVHDRVLAERAEAHHRPEIGAVRSVVAGRPVELCSDQQGCTVVAEVRVAVRAARAMTAGRDEAEHDVVAGRHGVHPRTDLDHDPGALVAADQRCDRREIAGPGVVIGVAHAGCRHLDEDLAGPRRVQRDGLHAPRHVRLPQDGGSGLHVSAPCPGPVRGTRRPEPTGLERRPLNSWPSIDAAAPVARSA